MVYTVILSNIRLFLVLKMFLQQQISILEWFLKIMRESEYWSNDAENSALHQINQLKYTEVGHSNCNNIAQYYCF